MDNKVHALVSLLSKNSFLTLKEIETETQSTRRQIYYRIEKINQELSGTKIEVIKSSITITEDIKNNLKNLIVENAETDYFLSSKERQLYMYLLMFIGAPYLSLNHFIDNLKVSKSTVLNELKELEKICNSNLIEIKYDRNKGYSLEGNEIDIRRFMMLEVINMLSKENNDKFFDLFINENNLDIFQYSKLVIQELSNLRHIEFVEDRIAEFIYIFIFLKARIANHKEIDISTDFVSIMQESTNVEIMKKTKEYSFVDDLIKNYKQGFCFSEKEKLYLTAWILGLSIGNPEEDTDDCLTIANIVDRMMYRFEILSGVQYKNTEDIFRKLYCHLRPTYYRLLYHLPIVNPLKDKVKEEHNKLYRIVLETVKPLEAIFTHEIPEDEVAYLTMHFGAIYANREIVKINSQKVGLIVCSNGLGSSAILYSELINLFPEIHFLKPLESTNINHIEEDYDIIFSTTYLDESSLQDKPIVYVRPVMNMQERYQVVREVCMKLKTSFSNIPDIEKIINLVKKYGTIENESGLANDLIGYFSLNEQEKKEGLMLSQMADPRLMNIQLEASDWEDAIRKSGQKLVDYDYATPNYIDEVINSTKINGPYYVITTNIALPHVKPMFGALKIGLGISILKTPIVFGNADLDPVKYIFFLTALDNETHLNALSILVDLFNDKEFFNCLSSAKTSIEVSEYIIKFEANKLSKS
ncbi:BglG family transcription antiterminator [Anaerorhabdus furcosa]|uniref:Transcriptional antiterminator n=1 Tax=Anaerorhabdus furcosa TaxID=118967 RepID=A0A1T4MMC6_9FIRM|nr:BglG family transcription antiterminator [Anaerorhabdus furcosa]SJZ68113.1 Transcriptional antiterminator [Anaerorhabdus furcosa]